MSNYGTSVELITSQAITPVSTETNLVFIGNAPAGTDNEPVLCKSMSDFTSAFGTAADTTGLEVAAKVCFNMLHLSQAIFIQCCDSTDASIQPDEVAGLAADEEGVYAVARIYPKYGLIPNIIVPCNFASDADVIAACKAACVKINGHWGAIYTFNAAEAANQVNANGIAVVDNVSKTNNDERGICCWPHIVTPDGLCISANVYIACLLAKADAEYKNIPMRTQGNLPASDISGIVLQSSPDDKIKLSESSATTLADKGITSFVNIGAGNYYTWGDSTAALTATGIADERGRFTNTIRIMLMLGNRFQQIWRGSIDAPMTPGQRKDILTEEQSHLDYLKSQGALLGYPKCEFRPIDNTIETIQRGEFYFTNILTTTPPSRFLDLKVGFTSEGYSVLLAA
jgi:phage tail sheath protein FI